MAEALENLKKATWFSILKDTVSEWSEDKAPRLGAALAYYTIFSLAPLIIVAIAIAGFAFGKEAAEGQLQHQLSAMIGEGGAKAVNGLVASAEQKKGAGIIASIIGIVTLLLGASGVFGQLKAALNTIWGVEKKPGGGIKGFIHDRILSFAMVLVIGFLLLVSLLVSALLAGMGSFLGSTLPIPEQAMHLLDLGISFFVVTLLFAMIYKYLPDVKIAWSNVWIGAAATSILFAIGKVGIGLYLGKSSVANAYGAAASLVVVLLWVYYSAQILFFGAEFTQVYAKRRGVPVEPADNAIAIDEINCEVHGNPKKRTVKAVTHKHDDEPAESEKATSRKKESYRPPAEALSDPVFDKVRPAPAMRKGEPIGRLLRDFALAKAGEKVLRKVNPS